LPKNAGPKSQIKNEGKITKKAREERQNPEKKKIQER